MPDAAGPSPVPATPPLCQVAASVADLERTHAWYRDVLGYRPAGGTRLFRGPLASRVQGLPRAASTCWWLGDAQDRFQLELFGFHRPRARPFASRRRPCDIGYTTLGVAVADLDAALARSDRAGTPALTDPVGEPGARRVCVRDPDGVLVELMEVDPRGPAPRARPRPGIPVATRFVTLSVPDLDRSRRFFVDTLGVPESGTVLHAPGHEALWGLAGACRETLVLDAGDVFLELVRYDDPVGRPWPEGYRISDQGLLNVALGFRDPASFDAVHRRALEAGYRANWRPLKLGAWSVVYLEDDQGFSVELLFVRPWYEARMGFRPEP